MQVSAAHIQYRGSPKLDTQISRKSCFREIQTYYSTIWRNFCDFLNIIIIDNQHIATVAFRYSKTNLQKTLFEVKNVQ